MNRKTEILSLGLPEVFYQAAEVIKTGGIIAFPTDTVYGIGASAFDEEAIKKIYQVKERSQLKAIPILVSDLENIDRITPPITPAIRKIMTKFWPGALTLVLPLLPEMPVNLSSTATIGLRQPDHDQVRELLRVTGPLAATSANLSGQPSALTAQEVKDQLQGRIDLILDGGPVPDGQASTVLDCTGEKPIVLRKGPISLESILFVLDQQD